MELEKLIGELDEGALPNEINEFLQALLEGRVRQFVIVAELDDGTMFSDYDVLSPEAGSFAMIGALEVMKHDYMRVEVMGDMIAPPAADDDEDGE